MHRLQIERFDQRDRIGKERVHVDSAQIALGAPALAAMVIGDAAIPGFERHDLRREQRSIPEQAVAEQDRWASAAGILVIELGAVDAEHGHDQSSLLPLIWRAAGELPRPTSGPPSTMSAISASTRRRRPRFSRYVQFTALWRAVDIRSACGGRSA